MSLYAAYLASLERRPDLLGCVGAGHFRGHAPGFLARRWIVEQGHLTHIAVPIPHLDGDEEVAVRIDEEGQTFSYASPGCRSRRMTRPLAEIALYSFNPDVWLDDLSVLVDMEPARRARRRAVIDQHLWHLGDLRIGRGHSFAPLYVACQLDRNPQDWRQALRDPIRPSQGIVLTAEPPEDRLPNGHQAREPGDLIFDGPDGPSRTREVLARLLQGMPLDDREREEYFDHRTGALKLWHMPEPKTFVGIQKKVIALFWTGRRRPHLKWSEVKVQTQCGKDLDSVFGKEDWKEWFDHVGRGLYRLRAGITRD